MHPRDLHRQRSQGSCGWPAMCCVLALGLIALQLVPARATSAARGALTGREADDRALVEDKAQATLSLTLPWLPCAWLVL